MYDTLHRVIDEEKINVLGEELEEKAFKASDSAKTYAQYCKRELKELRELFSHNEFRVAVLGFNGVGKTSLVNRLRGKAFKRGGTKASMTEEPFYTILEVSTDEKKQFLLHLVDWALVERGVELGRIEP